LIENLKLVKQISSQNFDKDHKDAERDVFDDDSCHVADENIVIKMHKSDNKFNGLAEVSNEKNADNKIEYANNQVELRKLSSQKESDQQNKPKLETAKESEKSLS